MFLHSLLRDNPYLGFPRKIKPGFHTLDWLLTQIHSAIFRNRKNLYNSKSKCLPFCTCIQAYFAPYWNSKAESVLEWRETNLHFWEDITNKIETWHFGNLSTTSGSISLLSCTYEWWLDIRKYSKQDRCLRTLCRPFIITKGKLRNSVRKFCPCADRWRNKIYELFKTLDHFKVWGAC